jgi:hypothetical protein
MAVLRSLVTTLGLNAAQFRQELQRSRQDFGNFTTSVVSGGKVVVGGVKTVIDQVFSLRSALIALGTGAALAGIKSAYESLDQTAQLGRNIGIAAGQWHAYAQAAEWAGSNGEKLADVIKDLNVKVAETAKSGGGSGPLADFFKQIGESAAEWSRLSPDDQLRKFTAELQTMSATDARFYLDQLNDSAAELFDTLYTNHGQLFSFVDEINRSGMALTDGQFAAVRDARLEIERLTSVMGALWEQVKASLAPAVAEGSKLIRTWITDSAEAKGGFAELGQGIALYIIEGVERASHAIKAMMDYAEESFRKVQMITGAGIDSATRDAYLSARQEALQAQLSYSAAEKEFNESFPDGGNGAYLAYLGDLGNKWEQAEAKVQSFLSSGESSGWDAYFSNLESLKTKIGQAIAAGNGSPASLPIPPSGAASGAKVLPDDKKDTKAKAVNYSAVDAFRSETQAIGQELEKRKALLENSQASMLQSEQMFLDQRASDIQIAYGSSVIDEQSRYAEAQQRLQKQYTAAYDAAASNHDLTFSLQQERYAAIEQLEQDHQTRILQIEQDRVAKQRAYQQQVSMELLSYTQQTMSITTDAMQQAGMEHTGVYKALFAMQKAAAIPSMIVATEEAATKAMAAFPPPYSLGLATAVRTMGYTSIGMVAGQALAGMAHDGIDTIPREGTWLLNTGERVLTNTSAKQMDEMHDAVTSGQGSAQSGSSAMGAAGTVIQHFYFEGVGGENIAGQVAAAARDGAKQGYEMVMQDFATRGQLRRMLNV